MPKPDSTDESKVGARNSRADMERLQMIHDYAVDNGAQCGPEDDAPVEPDALLYFGGQVKALGGGRVGGYLVQYGDPHLTDLEQEFFTADTDFGEAETSPVYYQHGLDAKLKRRRLGRAELRRDEFGIWAEAQLDLRDEYEQFILQMAEQGKMGWSSGTAAHLVEREPVGKAVWLKSWPLGLDASLTPTPAEPRNAALPLKSWQPQAASGAQAQAEPINSAPGAGEATTGAEQPHISIVESETMSDDTAPEIKALEDRLNATNEKLDKVLSALENLPSAKTAGYISNDGGKADARAKSFGDFLLAVRRNDVKRLAAVYGAVKTLNEDEGGSGSYLIPEEFNTQLLKVAAASSPILPLVRRIPVSVDAGRWPALDQFAAPTAGVGNTAMAAGVTAALRAEAAAYGETEPDFEQIAWRLHSISGVVPVSKELNADSPLAIEALLTGLFGVAVANKTEHYILRGTGVGQPLGILNAACAVGVDADVDNYFGYADALEITSRFKSVTGGARWVAHQSIIPDLGTWELGTAGAAAPKIGDLGYGQPIYSEHMPQADNAGCVLLADFGAYLLFEKGGLEIAYSEHAYFTTGRIGWRFDQRLDGQPWMKAAITLADPQGSFTVSPFVYNND